MPDIPLTRKPVSKANEQAFRDAVSSAFEIPSLAKLATTVDSEALFALLADPVISDPIYTIPKPVTPSSVVSFIQNHLEERERGEGLLMVSRDSKIAAAAYHDIQFWPQWGACELGGAIRPDLQHVRAGTSGAAIAFDWLFDVVGIELICETTALDNIRTNKLLKRLGFQLRGEIEIELPGGRIRPSNYWEMTRQVWCN